MQDSSAESVLLVQVRELLGLPSDIAADQLPEPGMTYLNYALSTVTRGELVLDRIRKYRCVKGLRFLDVGCAYGGITPPPVMLIHRARQARRPAKHGNGGLPRVFQPL